MDGVGLFSLILLLLVVLGTLGWWVFTQLRARKLGLPAPTLGSYNPFGRTEPSPFGDGGGVGSSSASGGGLRGWIKDKLRASKNKRSAAGAYEQPLASRRERERGFGPLDPNDAWDARVGNEADTTYGPGGYYEHELTYPGAAGLGGGGGLDRSNPYGSSGHGMNPPSQSQSQSQSASASTVRGHDEERGRSRDRPGGGGGAHASSRPHENPFDEDVAEPSNISLRGVSPRPIDTSVGGTTRDIGSASDKDSPTERRSIFREEV